MTQSKHPPVDLQPLPAWLVLLGKTLRQRSPQRGVVSAALIRQLLPVPLSVGRGEAVKAGARVHNLNDISQSGTCAVRGGLPVREKVVGRKSGWRDSKRAQALCFEAVGRCTFYF